MSDDARSVDPELIRSVWEEARDLIKRLEGSTVLRFSVQAGDTRIEIERGAAAPATGGAAAPGLPAVAGPATAAGDAAAGVSDEDAGHPIVSPLVGTFYRASQPGAEPFVQEGDTVDAGQTVAIVEAMKLMNQVNADRPGKISKIVVEEGAWVEFEQALMYLEPLEE